MTPNTSSWYIKETGWTNSQGEFQKTRPEVEIWENGNDSYPIAKDVQPNVAKEIINSHNNLTGA